MKNMKFPLLLLFLTTCFFAHAQKQDSVTVVTRIQDGDTIKVIELDPILISVGMDEDQRKAYELLKWRVKQVMPYAKLAAYRMRTMEDKLATIKGKRERKKFIRECEESLKELFKENLKQLSIEQGKILMKLIHRETGQTTWEIMKKYRGGTEALIWQSFGAVYGHNMKSEFDPVLDYQIENIIRVEKLE